MKNGFTLIELLITLVIFGIVSVFAITTYQSYVLRAGRSAAKLSLIRLATAQELYYTDHQQYATSLTQLDTRLADFASTSPAYVGSDGEFIDNTSTNTGYYEITLTMGNNTRHEYTLSATAIQKQARDVSCSDWGINQEGVRSGKKNSTTALTEAEIATCWTN